MLDKSSKSISIIGCGWLGMPLALELQNSGFKVQGTVRTLTKTESFNNSGINFFQLDLNPETESIPEIGSEFWQSDIFVLTIPPSEPTNYCERFSKILDIIAKQPRRLSIIYTSSTGVYGKSKGLLNETSPLNPDRPGAAAVVECEKLLLGKNDIFDVCILRLAGLVGPGRAPGRFFAGKKNLGSGSSPVNLVQLDDCVGMIVRLIKQKIKKGIYNICADQHPMHREFYPAQAIKLGLESPEYGIDSPDADMKIIDNRLLKNVLDYAYIYPDPMKFD
jgi:nucleoside-diphosphate-sugar epimerase